MNFLKRLFCKHKKAIWMKPTMPTTKSEFLPVKVCADCGKLTYANVMGDMFTYVKPEIIASRKAKDQA